MTNIINPEIVAFAMEANRIYSALARLYDFGLFLSGAKRAADDYFMEHIPFPRDMRLNVIDAGAGTGLFTLAVLRRFPNAKVVALDLNQDMLNALQKNLRAESLENSVTTFQADISKPLPQTIQNNADLVITGGVLEYVNPEQTVANLSKYLNPEGIFFNTPIKDNVCGKLLGYFLGFEPYSRERIVEVFTKNGFLFSELIKMPKRYLPSTSWKEGHIFRKAEDL